MDENDQKIRKQWLIGWISLTVMNLIYTFLSLYSEPAFQSFPEMRKMMSLLILPLAALFAWIFFYCAYRKPGTKLLLFSICSTVFSVLLLPFLFLIGKLSLPSFMPNWPIYLLWSEGLGILWIVLCTRMRRVNQKLQRLCSLEKNS